MSKPVYVAPTDFSDGCAYALKHAIDFAKRNNAHLSIIHVMQPTAYPVGMEMGHAPITDIQEQVKKASQNKLDDLKATVEKECECETVLRYGKPSTEIIDFAKEKNADLIFINTHGSGGLERFLFGSTTEKVLRKAECPVYVVRNNQG
jgi:nucleotide-binding universal stress UspA family protein